MQTFNQWLESRNLDAKQWTPELLAALRAQFEAQKPKQPPREKLVAVTTLEPEVRKPARQSKSAQEETDKKAIAQILEAIPAQPKSIQQSILRSTLGYGVDRFNRLLGQLVKSGQVKQSRKKKKDGKQTFVFYSKKVSDSGNDSGNSSGSP